MAVDQAFEIPEGCGLKKGKKIPAFCQAVVNDGGLDENVIKPGLRICTELMYLSIINDQQVTAVQGVLRTVDAVEASPGENIHKFYKIMGVGLHRSCVRDSADDDVIFHVILVVNIADGIHSVCPLFQNCITGKGRLQEGLKRGGNCDTLTKKQGGKQNETAIALFLAADTS